MTDWTHGTQSGSGWALPDITDTVSESEGKVDWSEIKCFPQITRLKLGNACGTFFRSSSLLNPIAAAGTPKIGELLKDISERAAMAQLCNILFLAAVRQPGGNPWLAQHNGILSAVCFAHHCRALVDRNATASP